MEQNQPKIIAIDNIEYEIEKMSDEAKRLLNHTADLENKVAGLHFQLQQAEVCRETFLGLLKNALSKQNEGDTE